MTAQHLDTVRSLYDSFARRDLDTIHDALSPDVVIQEPEALPWGGRHEGHGGFDTFIATLLRHVQPDLEVGELIDSGGHIIYIGGSRGTVLANNRDYHVREVHVWTFRDDKVASFTVYLDTPVLTAALAAA
jgi:hypothetical protein